MGGRIFGIYHPPADTAPDQGDFIFLPPFGEELNRSRHMIARQARAFAAGGKGVFIPDLFGTGDSDGRFEEADWGKWLENIATVAAWLESRGRPKPDLWALRAGALLATDAISQGILTPAKLLLWSPVSNGELFLNQFLRIRLAAGLDSGTTDKESTASLKSRLAAGEVIEVGGYGLNGALAQALSEVRLDRFVSPKGLVIRWLELGIGTPPTLGPAAAKLTGLWQSQGAEAFSAAVAGPPFWSLPEVEWADGLIELTLALEGRS